MSAAAPTRPGMLEQALAWPGGFLASLRTGPNRLLRYLALVSQVAFGVALLAQPKLVIHFFPSVIGGCTFCPARAVSAIDYRRGGEVVRVPVCSEHVHGAPASYNPRQQSLGNVWLLAPLFLFYCFLLLVLLTCGYFMLEALRVSAASRHVWPGLLVLAAGGLMTGIVALHARRMLMVTIFGEAFDAARWLFWLALPVTAFLAAVVATAFSDAAHASGTNPGKHQSQLPRHAGQPISPSQRDQSDF